MQVGAACTLPPASGGWYGVWEATRGACVRPCMRGAEERAVWLMCPIKLLQTLPRQLLPAGPWVQIGSVSLPQDGVSGARERRPAQHTEGPLPLCPSWTCCAPLEHLLTPALLRFPTPPVSNTGAPCTPLYYPDPHPWQLNGPSEPLFTSSRNGDFVLYRGASLRKPSQVTQHTLR